MQIFQSLDRNQDGKLSLEELREGMAKVMAEEEAQTQANRIVNSVDRKNVGVLDYSSTLNPH